MLKPLDGMGGTSIFRVSHRDPNLNVILETLTQNGRQRHGAEIHPEITAGDKRILLIDGEPVPYALARIPQPARPAATSPPAARVSAAPHRARRWIAEGRAGTGPRGMLFVGLDVIGDYLTEMNVTSPTCIRELDAQFGLNIAGQAVRRDRDARHVSRTIRNGKRRR